MSETTERLTLARFIAEHQIGMKAERAPSNPHMEQDAKHPMDHWLCTFNKPNSRNYTCYFSTGLGLRRQLVNIGRMVPQAPKAEDVLDCLASDAAGIENAHSFEDWCAEYGYDTDSRKAERTYRACKDQVIDLETFLGRDAYKQLLWETERL